MMKVPPLPTPSFVSCEQDHMKNYLFLQRLHLWPPSAHFLYVFAIDFRFIPLTS